MLNRQNDVPFLEKRFLFESDDDKSTLHTKFRGWNDGVVGGGGTKAKTLNEYFHGATSK